MSSTKRQARIAGLLYLLACIPAPFSLIYVPSVLMVSGDAAATANRLRASETLLRFGIAGELINAVAFIFATLALYSLLKRVNGNHALAMVILFLASVPISFLNVLNDIAALILTSGANFLSGFDSAQCDVLAYLFLRLHHSGVMLAQIFWGLWLFPFGVLVIRSGFIPRAVGVLLIIAGCGYMIGSFTSLLLPHYVHFVGQFALVLEFGELSVLWLLIWGAKDQSSSEQHPEPAVA